MITNGIGQLRRWRAGALALLGIPLALCSAHAAPPPIEAFGNLPSYASLAISPSGRSLAWGENNGKNDAVIMLDIESGRTLAKLPLGDKLRGLQWADEKTLLIELSVTYSPEPNRTYEMFRTLSLEVATGKTCILLLRDEARQFVTAARMLTTHTNQPHTVVMSSWDFLSTSYRMQTGSRLSGGRADSGWVYSVFSVDTGSCKGTVLERGTAFTSDWIVDANGTPVARMEYATDKREQSVLAKDGAGWKILLTRDPANPVRIGGVSADGRALLAIGALDGARAKLWAIPLDGSTPSIIAEDPERDATTFMMDTFSHAPVGVHFSGSGADVHWLDDRARSRTLSLRKSFADHDVRIIGHSQDFERVLAAVETPSTPPLYYFVDFKSGRADIVGEAYPELADAKLGAVRSLSYSARDGAIIPAYLTTPHGTPEKNLPLVVLPHGGPEARDYLKFDWLAQFLASRGYAVFQPQFRGSTGFGEAHRLAGYRQWGGLMQDDVTDGAKAMIEQGLADPRRICIVGASYGGYAALAGAAFTPDLYACAAGVNGVFDLPTYLSYHEQRFDDESDTLYYWRDHIGPKLDPRVAEKSPARAAAAIRIPVLLLHGEKDTIVPFSQSERMHQALARKKPSAKLIKLPGEDHWLSKAETRIRTLSELEHFLAQHIGTGAQDGAGSAAAP